MKNSSTPLPFATTTCNRARHVFKVGCLFRPATIRLLLFTLVIIASTPMLTHGKRGKPARMCTVPAPWAQSSPALEDARQKGRSRVAPNECSALPKEVLARLREQGERADPLKFFKSDRRVLTIQRPWLVLMDFEDQKEIRRTLPSQEYLNPNCQWVLQDFSLRQTRLAVSPQDNSVAVAFNTEKDCRVFVYDSELANQRADWHLPRYVQDLSWSPDGKTLAVLYNGHYNEEKKTISVYFAVTVPQPDVWILDAQTGNTLTKFSTGSNQVRIAFSNDGSLLYAINDYLYYGKPKGALRAFAVPSGELVRTFVGPKDGFHTNFAISPDSKLVVVDASTDWRPWYSLEYAGKRARFVVLNAHTGEALFRFEKLTYGEKWDPLCFAFSSNGKLLFVEFPRSRDIDYEHIDVFSLEGLY